MYSKPVIVDLFLYKGRDDDLIEFYQSLRPAVSRMLLCAMLEHSRREEALPIDALSHEGAHAKVNKANRIVIRLRVSRQQFPDLVEMWKAYPHGVRTTFFIAHLRNTLAKIKAGARISEKALLGVSVNGEFGGLFMDEEPGGNEVKRGAPPHSVEDEHVEQITIEAPVHLGELMDDSTGAESTMGEGSFVDDLLSSLDD